MPRSNQTEAPTGVIKRCPKCRKTLDTSLFYRAKDKRDGRSSTCRACMKAHYRVPADTPARQRMKRREEAAKRGIKICSTCDLEKDPEEFYEGESRCKPCCSKRASNYKRRTKNFWTEEEYQKAYKEQSGCCFSCGDYHEKLVGDHCHQSNKARHLLCNRCNLMIGLAKEDPEVLRNAAQYCEEWAKNANEIQGEATK
ncbi:endonuclease [Tsukamurella phage TIN4]|uniref:Endonuclease n=2 Tax=Tinduovirus TIN3 TaxID=1982571 RepID=A0A0K0N668_9CAUD|nr:endonuclease VII [Tsukamurella phage TIN3]YP_009604238.1 endonuclease VII [Tsukamurella phage TIN4]AKJ71905.1 endonuclease [Tsukamurella phage TIN3]AKJ72014.1 endonuclease [Tsukamurella phage TIN4]